MHTHTHSWPYRVMCRLGEQHIKHADPTLAFSVSVSEFVCESRFNFAATTVNPAIRVYENMHTQGHKAIGGLLADMCRSSFSEF